MECKLSNKLAAKKFFGSQKRMCIKIDYKTFLLIDSFGSKKRAHSLTA